MGRDARITEERRKIAAEMQKAAEEAQNVSVMAYYMRPEKLWSLILDDLGPRIFSLNIQAQRFIQLGIGMAITVRPGVVLPQIEGLKYAPDSTEEELAKLNSFISYLNPRPIIQPWRELEIDDLVLSKMRGTNYLILLPFNDTLYMFGLGYTRLNAAPVPAPAESAEQAHLKP